MTATCVAFKCIAILREKSLSEIILLIIFCDIVILFYILYCKLYYKLYYKLYCKVKQNFPKSQINLSKIANKTSLIAKENDNQLLNFTIMNVVQNIKEIRTAKGINQDVIAEALSVDIAVISKIENGKRELKVNELSKIANCLGVDILYLFTYPKVFVDKESLPPNNDKISVTFEISPDKREHLLKLITGK